jgi:hypothetical protein
LWIQSFESLAEAKKRLKQLARKALGDCFIYSEERGVVEFIVHGELAETVEGFEEAENR